MRKNTSKIRFSVLFRAKEPLSHSETNPFAVPNEPFRSPKEPLSHPKTNPFARKKSSSEFTVFITHWFTDVCKKREFWRYFERGIVRSKILKIWEGKFNNWGFYNCVYAIIGGHLPPEASPLPSPRGRGGVCKGLRTEVSLRGTTITITFLLPYAKSLFSTRSLINNLYFCTE